LLILRRAVQAGQARGLGQQRLRLGQHRRVGAIDIVEAARHFTRHLDVRRLVLADRHVGGLVNQDVGRLQQRVAEQAVGRRFAVLLELVLVAGDALQPAQRRAHRQQREQLGMLGQAALDEQRGLLGVDARGQPVHHHVVDIALDVGMVLVVRGHRMPVGHEKEAVELGLQAHPVLQRAMVVAQMQRAGGAHARQHTLARRSCKDGVLCHGKAAGG
jgi:hypothetical protein